jgi:DNA-directed RNA polymerase subunit RPC12/RpoP
MSDTSKDWTAQRVSEVIEDHYEPDHTDPNDTMYRCTRCGEGSICVAFNDDHGTPEPATVEAIIFHEEVRCPYRDDAV